MNNQYPMLDGANPSFHHIGTIAEFCQMAGSFAVFYELGIKNMIATSALPPEPSYMTILGAQFSMKIPGLRNYGVIIVCSFSERSKHLL
jgi:hypothetical protein